MTQVFTRMLIFQPTKHVVWESTEVNTGHPVPKRVPTICQELDYKIFRGLRPPEFTRDFINYKLIKSQTSAEFETGDLPSEFVQRVKLMRAKCYAEHCINSTVGFVMEKMGLYDNPLLADNINTGDIVDIYAQQLAIDNQQAEKLLQFKRSELTSLQNSLKLRQIEAELSLSVCTTVDEVLTVYHTCQTNLGVITPFDIKKML